MKVKFELCQKKETVTNLLIFRNEIEATFLCAFKRNKHENVCDYFICNICPANCVSLLSPLTVCVCCNLERVQFLYTLTLRCAWQFFTSSNKLCCSTTLGAHSHTSAVGFSRITPSLYQHLPFPPSFSLSLPNACDFYLKAHLAQVGQVDYGQRELPGCSVHPNTISTHMF